MRSSTIAWIVVVIVLVAGAWYYFSSTQSAAPTGTPAGEEGPSGAAGINGSPNQGNLGGEDTGQVQQPSAGSIIGANLALGTDSDETLGTYLIAFNGMTLYTYTKDTGSESTCYDQCAVNWPPYIVGSDDNINQLKAGVTGEVGTTKRTDGSLQMTYNGHPLYFYVKDTQSGDTKGQAVGGVWYVVKP